MTKLPFDIPDSKTFLVAKAYQRAHGELKKRLIPFKITNMQHMVLEALWYAEGATATELGRLLILDKATLSGVLERMLENGWIEKKQDLEDRRLFPLFPSEKANRLKGELMSARKAADEEIQEKLSVEERVLLTRLLRDLIE
ncbi:MAG: MarR family transcriptional regulator [Deltaproteobacteria bacterium]|jgi:DNA-binding MarR family transcriptional regulator|nr:MarR family transcriptional regulator [Deltaproteobacteria bacterium]